MAFSTGQDRSPTRLPCLLFELSDELLVLIAKNIHKKGDLRNFANSCQKLYVIADPVLYQNVTLRSISSCDVFAEALDNKTARAEKVQNLNLSITRSSENPDELDGHFICSLVKLRHMNITFPGLPFPLEDFQIYPPPHIGSLPVLQTCTLNLGLIYSEMWELKIAEPIFRHPTLEILTISFATLLEGPKIFKDAESGSTGLKELNCLSCHITPKKLTEILRLPRCLKQFTLGIPIGHIPWELDCSTVDYIKSMGPVYETLECFRLIPAPTMGLLSSRGIWCTGPATGIEELVALEYLEIPMDCLFEPITAAPALGDSIEYHLYLPPNLEVLKISPDVRTDYLYKISGRNPDGSPIIRKLVVSISGDEDVSEFQQSCEESGIILQVVRETPHDSFCGAPVWKIPGQIS